MTDFPAGFLFGSSTAAHQVEGGNVNNDWWAWEHAPGHHRGRAVRRRDRPVPPLRRGLRAARRASARTRTGCRSSGRGSSPSRASSRRRRSTTTAACSTRSPANGLTAFVTLHHFTIPRWLSERGGWLAPSAVDCFERYCERVARDLGDLMPYACTVNEPQIVALMGYLEGVFPPGERNPALWRRATRALIEAHRAAVRALGAGAGAPKAGRLPADAGARAGAARRSRRASPLFEELRAEMVDVYLEDGLDGRLRRGPVLLAHAGRPRRHGALRAGAAPASPLTQMGWEIHPEGLHAAIARAAAGSGLPVVVTENGIATADDGRRIAYLRSHLEQVARALREGIDVRGYLYWSSFDNFEWAEGYRPRFGLVGIDHEDGLRRIVRPSARAFGELARTRELDALTRA